MSVTSTGSPFPPTAQSSEPGATTAPCVSGIFRGGGPRPVTLGKHDDWVLCVLSPRTGDDLISTGRDSGYVTLWDIKLRARGLRSFERTRDWVEGMALSPDGPILATASADIPSKLWNSG